MSELYQKYSKKFGMSCDFKWLGAYQQRIFLIYPTRIDEVSVASSPVAFA